MLIKFYLSVKKATPEMIARRVAKCGDGSHYLSDEYAHQNQTWGFGDKDVEDEDAAELLSM